MLLLFHSQLQQMQRRRIPKTHVPYGVGSCLIHEEGRKQLVELIHSNKTSSSVVLVVFRACPSLSYGTDTVFASSTVYSDSPVWTRKSNPQHTKHEPIILRNSVNMRRSLCIESYREDPLDRDRVGDREATISLVRRRDVRQVLKKLDKGLYEDTKRLRISIGKKTAKRGGERLTLLVNSLGSLPLLEEVTLSDTCTTDLFVAVLEATTRLRKIKFGDVYFLRTEKHKKSDPWTQLSPCKLQHLEEIEFVPSWRHQPDYHMDIFNWARPCTETLWSQVPSLKKLVMKGGNINVLQLHALLTNCHQLEHIEIKGVPLSAKGFQNIAPSLQAHPRLHTFVFGRICLGKLEAQEALIDWVANSAQLQNLEFYPSFTIAPDNVTPVGRDLNLRNFLLYTIPRALYRNPVLKRCCVNTHILGAMVPFDVQVAWLELVRDHNCVLEELSLNDTMQFHCTDHGLHRSLQHYLKLNQLGRKHLQQQSDQLKQEEWIGKLEMATINVSCLYELLKMHPPIVTSSLEC